MSGFLLNVNSTVICTHGGQARSTQPDFRVKVMGQPVTTLAPYVITGCPLPPTAGGPCVIGNWVITANRIKASGRPVLLQSSRAVCLPTGASLTVLVANARVKGM